jgi:hypothetical protein
MGFMAAPKIKNPKMVFLDNCAQVSEFWNANLLKNICHTNSKMRISGAGGQSIFYDQVSNFEDIKVMKILLEMYYASMM